MNASPGRGSRQGRVRLLHRGEVVALGGEGHPDPPRDQPRRPERHDRGAGHPHLARRQDLARRRGRPRHGQDLRVRRGVAGRGHQAPPDDRAERRGRGGGRRHLRRRHLRRGLPRRGPGRRLPGRGVLRGPARRRLAEGRRPGQGRAPDHDLVRRAPPALRPGQRRHPRGRRARPPLRRAGHRPVPHRAHVPRRAARADRAADPGRGRRRARARRSTSCCRCSATTSSPSSPPWAACR